MELLRIKELSSKSDDNIDIEAYFYSLNISKIKLKQLMLDISELQKYILSSDITNIKDIIIKVLKLYYSII